MDHSRSNPGAIGRNKANRKADPQYHRAYKGRFLPLPKIMWQRHGLKLTACISCRNKKAKCNITAEEYASGLPCAKCRREMRACTFTTERHSVRRPGSSVDHGTSNSSALLNSPIEMSTALDTPPTPSLHVHAPQNSIARPGDPDLNDTMITTIVSNGNDALNLLFEAAQREERDVNGIRGSGSTDHNSPLLFMSPTSPMTSLRTDLLPELDSELLETWNAYRFVRMGWLSAEEVVWFVDMCAKSFVPVTFIAWLTKTCRFFKHNSSLSPVLDQCK